MNDGTNGAGGGSEYAKSIATILFALCEELADNARESIAHELRISGLARVIQRAATPFGPEQAEQVADVIQEAGDIAHARGSIYYERAGRIRKVSGGQ